MYGVTHEAAPEAAEPVTTVPAEFKQSLEEPSANFVSLESPKVQKRGLLTDGDLGVEVLNSSLVLDLVSNLGTGGDVDSPSKLVTRLLSKVDTERYVSDRKGLFWKRKKKHYSQRSS